MKKINKKKKTVTIYGDDIISINCSFVMKLTLWLHVFAIMGCPLLFYVHLKKKKEKNKNKAESGRMENFVFLVSGVILF